MVISHNLSAINTNRQLHIASDDVSKSAEKLSSGYKINRAADDAAGLSISEKMRKQIRGLDQASNNCEEGISLCNVADGALNEVTDMLQRMNELLVQAANGTNSQTDRDAINDELQQLIIEIDRVADATKFNERYIFKASDRTSKPIITDVDVVRNTTTINVNEKTTDIIWLVDPQKPDGNPANDYLQTDVYSATFIREERLDRESRIDVSEWEMEDDDVVRQHIDEYNIITTTTYKVNNQYLNFRKPGETVNDSTGYVNFSTEKNGISLSCGLSTLHAKIDTIDKGQLYATTYNPVTDKSDLENITTTYDMGDGISIIQRVKRIQNGTSGVYDTMQISFTVRSTAATDKHVQLAWGFDAMNAPFSSVNKPGVSTFSLESDDAIVNASATNTSAAVLADISTVRNFIWNFDKIPDNVSGSTHSGLGYQWDQNITAGQEVELGVMTYATKVKKLPWEKTTTKTGTIVTTDATLNRNIKYYLKGEHCNVQAGAETAEYVYIHLPNLSSALLRLTYEKELSAHKAEEGINDVKDALSLISEIRSYFGAITNRLEHAYKVDDITSENLSASESRIRDTDMAEESVRKTNRSLIQQAGQAMLAQANQKNQGVLTLLSA